MAELVNFQKLTNSGTMRNYLKQLVLTVILLGPILTVIHSTYVVECIVSFREITNFRECIRCATAAILPWTSSSIIDLSANTDNKTIGNKHNPACYPFYQYFCECFPLDDVMKVVNKNVCDGFNISTVDSNCDKTFLNWEDLDARNSIVMVDNAARNLRATLGVFREFHPSTETRNSPHVIMTFSRDDLFGIIAPMYIRLLTMTFRDDEAVYQTVVTSSINDMKVHTQYWSDLVNEIH
jgi:hypothetical protein